jgi:hypothetical protein
MTEVERATAWRLLQVRGSYLQKQFREGKVIMGKATVSHYVMLSERILRDECI